MSFNLRSEFNLLKFIHYRIDMHPGNVLFSNQHLYIVTRARVGPLFSLPTRSGSRFLRSIYICSMLVAKCGTICLLDFIVLPNRLYFSIYWNVICLIYNSAYVVSLYNICLFILRVLNLYCLIWRYYSQYSCIEIEFVCPLGVSGYCYLYWIISLYSGPGGRAWLCCVPGGHS